MASYPTIAAAVDIEVADKALCQALKVMCALTAGDKRHRDWVVASGAMPMLRRLALEHGRDVAQVMADARRAENAQKQERMEGASEADVEVDDALPLSVLRQVTRLLALLSADISGAGALAEGGWVPWLQRHAAATDCKISSCAARALLHVESAAAMFRGGAEVPLTPGEERWRGTLSRTAAGDHLLPPRAPMTVPTGECVPCDTSGGNVGSTSTSSANNGVDGVHLTQAVAHVSDLPPALDAAFARVKKGLDQFSMEVVGRRAAVPPSQRLVLHDGVHLFDPLAPHNEALARHGIDDSSPGELIDEGNL